MFEVGALRRERAKIVLNGDEVLNRLRLLEIIAVDLNLFEREANLPNMFNNAGNAVRTR